MALKRWNKEHFEYAQTEISGLEDEFAKEDTTNMGDSVKRKEIEENLRIQRARLESIFRQKSQEVWLKEGDRNTKFFHMSIMMRRRRNKILGIMDNKKWVHDSRKIGDYFTMKFQELYKTDYPHIPPEVDGIGYNYVMDQEIKDLIRIPTEQEIKDCVEKLHPLKSPGPDGFPDFFF